MRDIPLFLKPQDIQAILRIGKAKTYQLLHEPTFPSVRIGRDYRVPTEDFLAWVQNNIPASSPHRASVDPNSIFALIGGQTDDQPK